MTMRTLALLGILLCAFGTAAFAQTQNTAFSKGNEAYVAAGKSDGDAAVSGYRLAVENYRASIADGGDSWAAHFNLGNALFKLGYYGESVLEYERAQAIDPLRPETALNMATARQAAGLPAERPQGWIETLGLRLPLNAWLWTGAAGGWAFLALLILPFLHGGHKLVTVAGAVAALALACCAGLGALGWHRSEERSEGKEGRS
ncbi:MAG: tetratricopeptide repeat protein, partial [Opitutales bacterium]